jgi:hypothetical protein
VGRLLSQRESHPPWPSSVAMASAVERSGAACFKGGAGAIN